MSKFTVAGVSTHKGNVKVRFCSDMILRIKNLQKQGDTDIRLVELPNAMSKFDACKFLLESGKFTEFETDILEVQGKKAPKSLDKVMMPKVSVPVEVDDEELESIKELAAA